jgi:hypothetical protein
VASAEVLPVDHLVDALLEPAVAGEGQLVLRRLTSDFPLPGGVIEAVGRVRAQHDYLFERQPLEWRSGHGQVNRALPEARELLDQ